VIRIFFFGTLVTDDLMYDIGCMKFLLNTACHFMLFYLYFVSI